MSESKDKLKKQYNRLFENLKNFDESNDNETAHIIQDNIYKKFIKDIVSDKFKNKKEITEMAKKVKIHVVSRDKNRWYS